MAESILFCMHSIALLLYVLLTTEVFYIVFISILQYMFPIFVSVLSSSPDPQTGGKFDVLSREYI